MIKSSSMGADSQFQYYYGNEADQFNFIKIPKALFTHSAFKALSYGSKILYGILLDRMGLSMKNRWLDEENRVYIICTIKNVMEDFNVCKTTAVGFLAELEQIGLIEKRRRPNLPTIIYVKNFTVPDGREEHEKEERNVEENLNLQGSLKSRLPEVQNMDFQKQEVSQTAEIQGSPENRLPEVHKMDSNKTYINKTDNISISSSNDRTDPSVDLKDAKKIDDDKKTNQIVLTEEELKRLRERYSEDLVNDVYSGIQLIITRLEDGVLQTVTIKGKKVTASELITVFKSKINFDSINDVLKNIQEYSKQNIYNMQSYLLACIYNYKKPEEVYKPSDNSFNNFHQNTYDFVTLEEDILANGIKNQDKKSSRDSHCR